jgi:hypothetical protein
MYLAGASLIVPCPDTYLDDRGTLSCIFSFGASHGGGSWSWLIFIDKGASFSRIVGCVQIRETLKRKLE